MLYSGHWKFDKQYKKWVHLSIFLLKYSADLLNIACIFIYEIIKLGQSCEFWDIRQNIQI